MKPRILTLAILLASCSLHAQRWVQLNPPVNLFNDIIFSTVTDHNGKVYAGGAFTDSAGEKAVYVLNNGSWTELGTGDSTLHAKGNIYALTTDPSGNIYAAGAFTDASGNYYVAKWNGIYWMPMDPTTSAQNFTGQIFSLTSDKNGNIYAAGEMIDTAGNYYVSQFDGMKWQPLGTGLQSLRANGIMYAVTADVNGNIYAAGQFTNVSGYWYVAKWNGSNWSELGTGAAALNANGAINSLTVDASGNIYAAGDFKDGTGHQYVAKWDGNSWSELGTGTNALQATGMINTILIDAAGHLYAAGMLTDSNGNMVVSQWTGTDWSIVNATQGVSVFNNYINALSSDATGQLYVAGNFTNLRGDHYVARDSANVWTQPGFVGGRMPAQSNGMAAMAVDTGGHVFAVLGTTDAAGVAVVVRWDGKFWVTLPDTANGGGFASISGLSGDSLGNMYACGSFGASLGVAKWNGQGWSFISAAASGLTINGVSHLATDKIGNVYLSGSFLQNGYIYNLAKWDGSVWTAFANANIINFIVDPASAAIYANDADYSNSGYNVLKIVGNTIANIGISNTQPRLMNATNWMQTLALDANGNLYTGGSLEDSSGNAFVAKWDGTNWMELGKDSASFGAVGTINAIAFDRIGNLFAGGNLIKKSQTYIGKWDGSSWSTVGDATQFWEQQNLGFLDRDGQGNIYADVENSIYRYEDNQSTPPPPPPVVCYDSAQLHLVVNTNTLNGQNATAEIDAKGMPHDGTTTWTIEFASDRNYTNLLSGPSMDSVLILSAANLVTGSNEMYAKMQTLDQCNQTRITIDSVTITKSIAGGLVDQDFQNATITTYPNPVSNQVRVTGLNATKSYTIQIYNNQGSQVSQTTVVGETEVNVNFFSQQTGVYMLQVFDNTKNRKIGVMMLLKE